MIPAKGATIGTTSDSPIPGNDTWNQLKCSLTKLPGRILDNVDLINQKRSWVNKPQTIAK